MIFDLVDRQDFANVDLGERVAIGLEKYNDNVGNNNHVKTSQMLIKGQKLQLDCKKMKATFKSWSSDLEVIYTV